jgi:hypothetical protein
MNSAGKDDVLPDRLVYRMNETGPPLLKDILHKKGKLISDDSYCRRL